MKSLRIDFEAVKGGGLRKMKEIVREMLLSFPPAGSILKQEEKPMKPDKRKVRTGIKALAVLTAFAGISVAQPAGKALAADRIPITEYDEETLAKLSDNKLEYQEIPGLIEQYNTAFRNQLESYYANPGGSTGLTRDQMITLAQELRAEAKELEYDAEEMKDNESLSDAEYQEYKDNVKALRQYAKGLEDSAAGKSAAGTSAIRGLRVTRENQTRSACGKMREYQKLADQADIQKKTAEIAELTYEAAKKQQELGLYSAENVLDAREALDSANAAYQAAMASMESEKQDLLTMLGWSYDANPEIQRIPAPDVTQIASMNVQADEPKAIENNYALYDIRMTDSSASGGAVEKARKVQDQENKIRENLGLLYQEVLQKQAAYEAAQAEFSAAQADFDSAGRKNSMGMLSRQEYLSAEAAFLTAQASYDSAGLDLTAAMEDYSWAVKGLMDSDSGQN